MGLVWSCLCLDNAFSFSLPVIPLLMCRRDFDSFRCVVLNAKEAEDKYLLAVHSKNHVNLIRNISSNQFDSRRNRIALKFNSIYFNDGSSEAAYIAAGSVVEVLCAGYFMDTCTYHLVFFPFIFILSAYILMPLLQGFFDIIFNCVILAERHLMRKYKRTWWVLMPLNFKAFLVNRCHVFKSWWNINFNFHQIFKFRIIEVSDASGNDWTCSTVCKFGLWRKLQQDCV